MAKKFRFRLESILNLRSEKVDEAKNDLNVAIRYRNEKEDEIENLSNQKQQKLNEQNKFKKAQDMQALKDHINSIDYSIEKKNKEKEKLIEIENARRLRLNEAMKEEKVIMKLKEKKIEEHQHELLREETNFLDDIATQQYIKKITK
jgi:flagellar FliJ protein